jgi:hypothetical protein
VTGEAVRVLQLAADKCGFELKLSSVRAGV